MLYDTIGRGHANVRKPDPRIAETIAVLTVHHWSDKALGLAEL